MDNYTDDQLFEILQQIMDQSEGKLSDWEKGFVGDVLRRKGTLTERQRNVIIKPDGGLIANYLPGGTDSIPEPDDSDIPF